MGETSKILIQDTPKTPTQGVIRSVARGKTMKLRISAFAIAILQSTPAFAFYSDYLPAPLVGKSKMLKQHAVAAEFGPNWTAEVLSNVRATNAEARFKLQGVDKNGQSWTLEDEEDRGLGGACFTADVDKNGCEDIILWFATGSCGLPFSVVQIIFFDKDGRPHKEEAVSRFSIETGSKSRGLQDLIESGDSKGAYLLVQDLTYGSFGNKDRSYWRWSMLRAENCRLTEIKSAYGINLPSYVWFTNKANHLVSRHGRELEKEWQRKEK